MGLFKRRKMGEGLNRQIYMISNLGLFYLIIIGLFGVPLLGTFVVVLIKGVIDLRLVIVPVISFLLCLLLVWGIRGLVRLMRRIGRDGRAAMDTVDKENQQGRAVHISMFNGLISLTFGNTTPQTALPHHSSTKSLPAPLPETGAPERDIACKLKDLVDLRNAGDIDHQEFEYLKAQVISASDESEKKQQDP